MIIYKAQNKITQKVYIGKTIKTLNERKKSHLNKSKMGVKSHFYDSIRKYGEESFIWSEIIKCDNITTLNEMELFFIEKFDSFKNGYNMTIGGDGGDTISSKSISDKKNQGAKPGNIPWNKGKKMKEMGYTFYENRKSRSPLTFEQKTQHSISIKNSENYRKGLTKRHHGMSKKVIRVCDGKSWETIVECANDIKLHKAMVRRYIMENKPINGEMYVFSN
jgi:group I intron endonuclease